jgi:regulatory protein
MDPRPRQPLSLKARALRWLANREHSQLELRTKLLRAAGDLHSAAEIDALLEHLAAQGHLSTERFVESRLHARSARFGNRRIEQEMRQHGVTLDAHTQTQLRATEVARAREVWRKKFGVLARDAAGRARQARFLAARGFSAEVVHKIVSNDHEIESI